MAINLHITVARGDDNRLQGTVRALDGHEEHTFSGTLELLRVFEDLLAADPAAMVSTPAPVPAAPDTERAGSDER